MANRTTIGNMSPEYGSTCAIFPIDQETLRYLTLTGRSAEQVALVEQYAKLQGLWHNPESTPRFSENIELDLSTAFLANSAAPIMTDGFEVFVHEVMEAITTSPFFMVVLLSLTFISIAFLDVLSPKYVGKTFSKAFLESEREIRSCGRLGPAIDGTTVERSNLTFRF